MAVNNLAPYFLAAIALLYLIYFYIEKNEFICFAFTVIEID